MTMQLPIIGPVNCEGCGAYNEATKRCRNYDWRPDCCREFEVGEKPCLDWRKHWGIDAPLLNAAGGGGVEWCNRITSVGGIGRYLRPDDDRCAHDHPWWFVRVILLGGYWERCGENDRLVHRKPWRPWAPWRVYWCGPSFRHRIVSLPRGRSWTLVLCGRHTGRWGFFTRRGWMDWREFVDAAWSNRVLWCEDGREVDLEKQRGS